MKTDTHRGHPSADLLPAPLASAADRLDPSVRAAMARALSSISAASATLAFTDWALHLAASPGKRIDLVQMAIHQGEQLTRYAGACMGTTTGTPPARGASAA